MGLRLAFARLVATPLFTVFSIVSLASGVAITTAVYSVVDSLMLRDLGVPEPDRGAFLVSTFGGRARQDTVSAPDFDDLKRELRSFSSLASSSTILPSVASTSHAELVFAEAVDDAYFTTLRIGAARGRTIQAADQSTGADVAVISDEFWRTRFAADRSVIGRTIRINGRSFDVIGVAPPRFEGIHGPFRRSYVWIPLAAEASLGTTRMLAGRAPREQRTLMVSAGWRLASAKRRRQPSSRRSRSGSIARSRRRSRSRAAVRATATGRRRPSTRCIATKTTRCGVSA